MLHHFNLDETRNKNSALKYVLGASAPKINTFLVHFKRFGAVAMFNRRYLSTLRLKL